MRAIDIIAQKLSKSIADHTPSAGVQSHYREGERAERSNDVVATFLIARFSGFQIQFFQEHPSKHHKKSILYVMPTITNQEENGELSESNYLKAIEAIEDMKEIVFAEELKDATFLYHKRI